MVNLTLHSCFSGPVDYREDGARRPDSLTCEEFFSHLGLLVPNLQAMLT